MTKPTDHPDTPDRPEPVEATDPATVPLSAAPPPPPPPPARRPPWYRRLPGHLGLWVAALAFLAACVIGCSGFVAGVVASHGFGDRRAVSRNDRWGPGQPGARGGRFRDGRNGPTWQQRGPRHRRTAPAPMPSATVPPAQPPAPSPAASPTA